MNPDWRDIATAPIGEPILLWGRWVDCYDLPSELCCAIGTAHRYFPGELMAWLVYGNRDGRSFVPTHWMPLPCGP